MTNKELIEKLSKLDPELPVFRYDEQRDCYYPLYEVEHNVELTSIYNGFKHEIITVGFISI